MTFDLYTTKAMESNVKNNHILWIIEHSYPAISMDRLFTEAGVVGSTLRSEVLGLAGNTGLTDDEKVENVEDFLNSSVIEAGAAINVETTESE